ncbi:hypothetical protein [Methylobacterium goesingense]|uniref:Uncharacterized protein n=1 Tax=Methylobacterium goesingense TaxID=243690 RepID=A0ABV2L757_9HYPH|nr:hypothetical protein [Methylobacterium goesingense]GJD72347.1 hypothetical protein CFIICLFH_0560 [Methylobacterium goesingense]
MRNSAGYSQLIPMVQAVLDTLQRSIALEEAAATDLAERAHLTPGSRSGMADALLATGRKHAIRALELRGKRAALLAEYGLEPD